MNKINKITSEIFSQFVSDRSIFDSFEPKIKDKLKKLGVASLLALTGAMSAGTAHAFDIGSVVNLITNPGYNPQSYYYNLSDVPAQCNDFNNYVLTSNVGSSAEYYPSLSKQKESQRLECAKNVYQSYNVSAPKYRQNTYINSATILYEVRDYVRGQSIQFNYGNSLSVKAFESNSYGSIDISSQPKLKIALDERSKQLVIAHELLNKVSRDFLINAYGTDNPNQQNMLSSSRINMVYKYKEQVEKAYDNYAQARTDFVTIADSAANLNYNISNYASTLDFYSPPESTNLVYKGRIPNRYTFVTPANYKI